jgi:hypothetical protein
MDFMPSHRLQSRLNPHLNQALMGSSHPIPVFVAVKRRSGQRQYARCVLRGFHDAELRQGRPYVWTREQAVLECHFPSTTKLKHVWLEVGATSPQGATIDVMVDDELFVAQRSVFGRSTIRFHLREPRLVTNVTIAIRTTTFVPASTYAQSNDARTLGIALEAVVFGKRRTKYASRMFCRDSLHQRLFRSVENWWLPKAA